MNAETYATMNDDEMIHCSDPARQFERAVAIMHRLRAPGGCPWDAQQTHESLISNLIEECYECIDAIRERDAVHLCEELGDVLLQVLFHAELAQENATENFNVQDVARGLCDKMVRRHPHVFGDATAENADAVLARWDQIKRREQHGECKPYLHNCGKGLPELMRAAKISAKAAKVGFDWESNEAVLAKVHEELDEVRDTLSLADEDPRVAEELGDIMLSVVNLCRRLGVNPEEAMHAANQKFLRRFNAMEAALASAGISLQEASVEMLDRAWNAQKAREKAGSRASLQS